MDKSSAREIHLFVPETAEVNAVETCKVRDLHNFDSFKHSTENGSGQNQEQNLSTENIIEAFFCTLDNQRKELQIVEKHLSETIQKLEKSIQENAEASDAVKKVLREQIEQGMVLLRELRITLSLRESREKSMQLQLAAFRESLSQKDSEASADGMKNNQIKIEMGSLTPQTITDSEELDETSDEDLAGKRQMELHFVKTILKAAKIRQKIAKTEDSNEKDESN